MTEKLTERRITFELFDSAGALVETDTATMFNAINKISRFIRAQAEEGLDGSVSFALEPTQAPQVKDHRVKTSST